MQPDFKTADLECSLAQGPENGKATNEADPGDPLTVVVVPGPLSYLAMPALSARSLPCGPFVETKQDNGRYLSMKTPEGEFDLAAFLEKLPADQQPEVVIVWVDATGKVMPVNLDAVHCRRIALIGDMHHMRRPIRRMLGYVAQQPYDAIFVDLSKAHYFLEAGLAPIFWDPGWMATPHILPFRSERRREIMLVGQVGSLHPRRQRVVAHLTGRNYPLRVVHCAQETGFALHNQSLISLNVTLNADLNLRFHEIPAAGGFMVTDRISSKTGLSFFYQEGLHYVGFSSLDELDEVLDHYLAHPEEAITIARAAQQRYCEVLSPPLVRQRFWRAALQGRPDPIVDVAREPRCRHAQPAAGETLLFRAGIYEFVQECHRRQETVSVLFRAGAWTDPLTDLVDLPRLRLVVEETISPALAARLRTRGADQRVETMTAAQAEQSHWDIMVSANFTSPTAAAAAFAPYRFDNVIWTRRDDPESAIFEFTIFVGFDLPDPSLPIICRIGQAA
ncbi:MAG: glycosyltransferase [Azospirillaceae bacterium]|nr:glycosyltransferase [Azospirillaceae bacterium]